MSIWGNAITLGSSGGGSGPSASDAILTVTVPTGSTVTAVKGGVTLTPTMWVQAADATLDCALFVISAAQFDSVNPWTVTATRGTDETASYPVTIDSNEQYELTLTYRIPTSTYQEVEYIEAAATNLPYIDLAVHAGTNTKAHIKFVIMSRSGDVVFGSNTSEGKDFRFFNYNANIYFDIAGDRISGGTLSVNNMYEFELGNHYVRNVGSSTSIISGTVMTYQSTENMTLGYDKKGNRVTPCRWYYVKVWNGTTLQRDMIPCYRKSDSVPGMWDRVSKTFFTNAGTGLFYAGPDVN